MEPVSHGQTRRGMVISDLHLLARRSHGLTCFESVRAGLGGMDLLVFNGDTFDFRWSTLPSKAKSVRAAQGWLERLLDEFPRCHLHFVLGNHDCLDSFQERLMALAREQPRFQWHEHSLQLGRALFLHGDCAQPGMNPAGLLQYRSLWRQDRQRSRLAGSAYHWADRLRITRLVHAWHFPQERTVFRIARYLDQEHPEWRTRIQDCYFGHTHLPFSGYHYQGIRFHNTGSAVGRRWFNPISFEC